MLRLRTVGKEATATLQHLYRRTIAPTLVCFRDYPRSAMHAPYDEASVK